MNRGPSQGEREERAFPAEVSSSSESAAVGVGGLVTCGPTTWELLC